MARCHYNLKLNAKIVEYITADKLEYAASLVLMVISW